MKHVRFLPLAVVLVAALTTGCSPTSQEGGPQEVLETFYQHLNSGEYAAAITLYEPEARESVGELSSVDFATWAKQETGDGQFKQVRILEEEEAAEDSVTLRYEVQFTDGSSPRTRTVTCIREGGAWKLGFII